MKKNILLRTIILLVFIFLVLFSFISLSSLAQCTGDFNSDGKVDFEDLMIFALAYGSSSSDDNWDPRCDLEPDNKIDFEDLMLFAMNYGETSTKGSITGTIMVPESGKTKDITGWVSLPNATVTLTDSTGQTHTVNTDENGNYSFSQVPPGNNYIITATGEVEGNTVVLKDVVPQLAEGEDYDAGTADAESTAIALVVESILESDPNLSPDDVNLDDISTAESLPALEDAVQDTLDNYGDVTTDPEVLADVQAVEDEVCDVVQNVHAIALTTPYSLGGSGTVPTTESLNRQASNFSQDSIIEGRKLKIEDEQFIIKNLPLEQPKGDKEDTGEIYYSTLIYWDPYFETDGNEVFNYKVYRSTDGVNYNDVSFEIFFTTMPTSSNSYKNVCVDINIDPNTGSTYSYYITAYGADWETAPSSKVTIDTWIPGYCILNSPQDDSLINEVNPIFTWTPVRLGLPYGSIISGESDLWVADTTATEESWWITFPDLMTSTATYNQDGYALSLVPGHSYIWDSLSYGYNQKGALIALAISGLWSFDYKITEGTVSNVYAVAVTSQSGALEHSVEIYWDSYPEAVSYNVYRSVNGEEYTLLPETSALSKEFPPDNNWHLLEWFTVLPIRPPYIDEDVSPENNYSYYVVAIGDGWETAASETAAVDTWLPPCVLISPEDQSNITEPNPIFSWDSGVYSLPYASISAANVYLGVWNEMDQMIGWGMSFDDITLSSAKYNLDGQGDPLFSGNNYQWGIQIDAYDVEGNYIARSSSENWNFSY